MKREYAIQRNAIMIAMYQAGATAKEAADAFGLAPSAMRHILKMAGIPLRTRSEGQRIRWEKWRQAE